MDTIFINSENSRTSEYHILVIKLTDKLSKKYSFKSIPRTITINLKCLLQHGVMNLKYQTDHT